MFRALCCIVSLMCWGIAGARKSSPVSAAAVSVLVDRTAKRSECDIVDSDGGSADAACEKISYFGDDISDDVTVKTSNTRAPAIPGRTQETPPKRRRDARPEWGEERIRNSIQARSKKWKAKFKEWKRLEAEKKARLPLVSQVSVHHPH
mmetsp:Transcript_68843/g.193088  ORF Transcript_68843/g.193088 Transcript_68843/m.193088 type:complete len:149 (-) Transcript_68843:319-765(-)